MWIGSIAYDGHPESIADAVLDATTKEEFLEAVAAFFKEDDHVTLPEHGWPWPWKSSHLTDYSYALDGDQTWRTTWGEYPEMFWVSRTHENKYNALYNKWHERDKARDKRLEGYNVEGDMIISAAQPDVVAAIEAECAKDPCPKLIADGPKCEWPDMTDIQNITFGSRSGILLMG